MLCALYPDLLSGPCGVAHRSSRICSEKRTPFGLVNVAELRKVIPVFLNYSGVVTVANCTMPHTKFIVFQTSGFQSDDL
ncbi:hypothetical protein BS78_05G140200 [Paspalum vaginatum]|nr:hypothetical protein BS78_05G140200 [Paspalum vaginatum]